MFRGKHNITSIRNRQPPSGRIATEGRKREYTRRAKHSLDDIINRIDVAPRFERGVLGAFDDV